MRDRYKILSIGVAVICIIFFLSSVIGNVIRLLL